MAKAEKHNVHISNRDKKYLALAGKVALSSELTQKHGCVIVRGNSVLSIGVNKHRNINGCEKDEYTIHAEIDAVNKGGDIKGATAYIARAVSVRGNACGYSKPCGICHDTLVDKGIKRIVYTESGDLFE